MKISPKLQSSMVLLMATACVQEGAFMCDLDNECVMNGEPGRCEPTGFCSFPDASCDSGHRYGQSTNSNLDGRCVISEDEPDVSAPSRSKGGAETDTKQDVDVVGSTDCIACCDSEEDEDLCMDDDEIAGVCVSAEESLVEICNGLDDDCNGSIDEVCIDDCPTEWFEGHAYSFCTGGGYTWESARDTCEENGANLVIVETEAEDIWLREWIEEVGPRDVWLGLSRSCTTCDDWTWIDGTPLEETDYRGWAPDQPGETGLFAHYWWFGCPSEECLSWDDTISSPFLAGAFGMVCEWYE